MLNKFMGTIRTMVESEESLIFFKQFNHSVSIWYTHLLNPVLVPQKHP